MARKYMFLEESLEKLQEEIRADKKEQFKRLYEQCRLYKEERLYVEHPDKSTTYIGMAVFNLSLAYILTKQTHYLIEAKRWMFTAVNYPHWGNKFLVDVDLSAAWMLFGLSIGYDWLKEDLTEEERAQVQEKIILQGNRMYAFKIKTEGEGWSTAYWQNHNWINLTGLATAGYALGESYEDAKLWVACAKENFEKVYAYMPEDGSDYEGVVYWRYGVIWLYIYAHLLKVEEGIDYFKTCSFLKETFYYRLYQAMPNLEEIANFGDCHDKRSGHSVAMYYKMASEYNNGYAQYLGDKVAKNFLFREQYESKVKPGILPEAGLELLWYNNAIPKKTFVELPLVKYFEDLGLVVMRSNWEEDGIHFSFKCGAPGGKKQWEKSWELFETEGIKARGLSHQHADNNSFILHGFDTFLAIDEGYNRAVKAKEHNVITVDGKGYRDEGKNNIWHETPKHVNAEIIDFITENNITYTAGDAYKMYDESLELTKCIRHILYTGSAHFFIIDEVASRKPHYYTFNLHTESPARSNEDGSYDYENGPGAMRIYTSIDTANTLVGKTGQTYVKAIMTSQEPDIYREINMDTLYLENCEQAKEVRFFNILSARSSFEEETLQVARLQEAHYEGYSVVNDNVKEVVLLAKEEDVLTYEEVKAKGKILYMRYEENRLVKVLTSACEMLHIGEATYYEGDAKTMIVEVK